MRHLNVGGGTSKYDQTSVSRVACYGATSYWVCFISCSRWNVGRGVSMRQLWALQIDTFISIVELLSRYSIALDSDSTVVIAGLQSSTTQCDHTLFDNLPNSQPLIICVYWVNPGLEVQYKWYSFHHTAGRCIFVWDLRGMTHWAARFLLTRFTNREVMSWKCTLEILEVLHASSF